MAVELVSYLELRRRKIRKWSLRVCYILVAVALPLYRYGPSLYTKWRQHTLLTQAHKLMEKEEYRKASLCLNQVLEINPSNMDASRSLAVLADKAEMPSTVAWFERVTELQPNSVEDVRAWARAAIRWEDKKASETALARLKEIGPEDAAYHELAGCFATINGRLREAQSHFSRLVALEPAEEKHQLALAGVELNQDDKASRDHAVAMIEKLRSSQHSRLAALRLLIGYEEQCGRLASAFDDSQQLASDPNATFQDHIDRLSLLRRQGHTDFPIELNAMQERTAGHADEMARLILWMTERDMAVLALNWVATLPKETISDPNVARAIAGAYLKTADWKGLDSVSAKNDWGFFEFQRLLFRSRALKELGDASGSQTHWNESVSLSKNRPAILWELQRIANAWQWNSRGEEVLWLLASDPKERPAALQTLLARYQLERDSRNLHRVWAAMMQADSSDEMARINWIMLSFVLKIDVDRASELASDIYQKNPEAPLKALSYAFSRHLQGHTEEGIKVMRALKSKELREPSIAAYYGVLLAANGEVEDALQFLDLAKQASLLPEEQELVMDARRLVSSP